MNFNWCPSQDLSQSFNLLFDFLYSPIWSFLVFIFFPFFIPLHSFSFLNCLAHSINCIYYSTNVVNVAKAFQLLLPLFFSFIRRSLPSIFCFVDAFRVYRISSNLNHIILISSSSSSLMFSMIFSSFSFYSTFSWLLTRSMACILIVQILPPKEVLFLILYFIEFTLLLLRVSHFQKSMLNF